MPKHTVLIADDHPDTREILRTILALEGFEVLTAMNGEDAVDMALEHRPDLVFMDLMMPGLDGTQALAAIRDEVGADTVPVAAVTARSVTADEMREAGFCALLRKPVRPDKVARAARTCIDEHAAGKGWIAL
jgi:CheY-like chemotaxis protein